MSVSHKSDTAFDEASVDERTEHYFRRTVEHIHRVQKNALLLVASQDYRKKLGLTKESGRELMHQVMLHDRSKFSVEQFDGYVEMTEYFRQRKTLGNANYEYPAGARELSDLAWQNHWQVENHHPERVMTTGGKWTSLEAIECSCDLQAMAQEYNEGSGRGFWKNVWLPKHRNSFYDDFNYWNVHTLMDRSFECFEQEMKPCL